MAVNRLRARAARVLGLAITSAFILSLVTSSAVDAGQSNKEKQRNNKLGRHDQELLATARARGESTVTLLIAAGTGQNSAVVSAAQAEGAAVRYRNDKLDYVRVTVPIDAAEKVADLAGVVAADVDEIIPLDNPRPDGIAPIIPQTAPGANTPNNNPYMPTRDTGASQFVADHKRWDGRGVTVGIVDTGVSFDHPSLVTTSTGERKIVEWVTGTDPLTDPDPTWVNMSTQVTGATFTAAGGTYTAPAAGSYRFGRFNERDSRFGGELGNDANRDGNPAGSSGFFAVLWNTTTNQVWVDIDQDLSFADQTAMKDYKVNYDIGWFGTDNPATAVRDQLPFVVQTDTVNRYVNIGVVSGAHGSHVAGILAGNSLFGGKMSGAAPGAKIVSSRACLFVAGCTAHALLEGMIFVATQANVDIINMSIGGLPALNDGNNTRAEVYDRLIDEEGVQMFISAGNSGPGLNTVGDPSVATKVISVGASITDETYLKDYGVQLRHRDNILYFSSRGPREDGGFKPNIVAPGAAVSSTPMWQLGSGLPYTLPPGYSLFNGTSMASPMAAGSAALLLSAAKATDRKVAPPQLRQAINSSARFLDDDRFQAYDQGNGLMNVGAAWKIISKGIEDDDNDRRDRDESSLDQTSAAASGDQVNGNGGNSSSNRNNGNQNGRDDGDDRGLNAWGISATVPVNTVLSAFLKTPGIGVGIHDREGVTIGKKYSRTYTFTRTSGPNRSLTYRLSWVGNDGTFSTGQTLRLEKNRPTTLRVNIDPRNAGAHSAILNVDDPETYGIDFQTMNVVIAPYEYSAASGFSQTVSSTIDIAQAKHYFVRIPAGVPAFKVDFSGPSDVIGTGQARFMRWHPWGLAIDDNAVSQCYSPPAAAGCSTGSPNSRTTTNPLAGVWEVSVDARRTSDANRARFTLGSSILGATVSPNPDIIASATIGTPLARSYTLTNLFGAFTGRATASALSQSAPLGSARRGTFTIADLEVQEYEVEVSAGSTSFRATIGSPSDASADLDLFVFRCAPGCVLVGQNADGDSEESVTINNPTAGTYLVVVDGFAVPAGTTTYKYIDIFINTALGSISITDANALRPSGSSWTVPGTVTANLAPAMDRVLYGNVQVRTDTNVLVGTGEVIVQNVIP